MNNQLCAGADKENLIVHLKTKHCVVLTPVCVQRCVCVCVCVESGLRVCVEVCLYARSDGEHLATTVSSTR